MGEGEPGNLKEQKQSAAFLSSGFSRKPICTPRGSFGDTKGSSVGGRSSLILWLYHTELPGKNAGALSEHRVSQT